MFDKVPFTQIEYLRKSIHFMGGWIHNKLLFDLRKTSLLSMGSY